MNLQYVINKIPKKIKACGYSNTDIKSITIEFELEDGTTKNISGKYSTCHLQSLLYLSEKKESKSKDKGEGNRIIGIEGEIVFNDSWLLLTVWHHEDQRYRWEQGMMKGKELFICKPYEKYTEEVS